MDNELLLLPIVQQYSQNKSGIWVRFYVVWVLFIDGQRFLKCVLFSHDVAVTRFINCSHVGLAPLCHFFYLHFSWSISYMMSHCQIYQKHQYFHWRQQELVWTLECCYLHWLRHSKPESTQSWPENRGQLSIMMFHSVFYHRIISLK